MSRCSRVLSAPTILGVSREILARNQVQHIDQKASSTAMQWADADVLVLPSGRSAHLEAGWFVGQGKGLVILLNGATKPELMYKMADKICLNLEEAVKVLRKMEASMPVPRPAKR